MDMTALGSLAGSLARENAPLIGKLLTGVATMAATAAGGPLAGSAAGFAMDAATRLVLSKLGTALGTSDDPAAIETAVNADPSRTAPIVQQVENDHADLIKATLDAANEELRLRLLDVQDARATEAEYVKAGSFMQAVPGIWTLIMAAAFFTVMAVFILRPVTLSEAVATILNILIGVLVAEVSRCGSFWMGSSQSSRLRADQAIDFASRAPATIVKAIRGR